MTTRHDELQAVYFDLAHALGWRHLHIRRSIGRGNRWTTTTNVVGWPDGLLWSPRQPGRHIAVEFKIPPDGLKPEQEACRDDLVASGFEHYVVTPETDLQAFAGILRGPR